jgi:hypothetical protein
MAFLFYPIQISSYPSILQNPDKSQLKERIREDVLAELEELEKKAHHHKTSPPSPTHGYLSRAAGTIFRSWGRVSGSNRGRWLDSEARMSWHGCGFHVECAQARCGGCWKVMLILDWRRVKVGGENNARSRVSFHVFGVFWRVQVVGLIIV